MTSDQKTSINSLLIRAFDGTFLAAGVTAVSYALAWEYEVGYLDFFGIPATFATVPIGALANAFTALLLPPAIGYAFVFLVTEVFRSAVKAELPWLSQVSVFWVIVMVVLRYFYGLAVAFPESLTIAAIVCALPLLTAAFRWRTANLSYADKLRRQENEIRLDATTGAPRNLAMIIIVVFVFVWSAAAGHNAAHRTVEFAVLTLDGGERCIVLRQYGDEFLCTELVEKLFHIVSAKETGLSMTVERIGPLDHVRSEPYEKDYPP